MSDIRKALQEGVQVAVSNLGRLRTLFMKDIMKADDIKLVVLEEVDSMPDGGLEALVKENLKFIPRNAQIAFFTDTAPVKLWGLAQDLMMEPVTVVVIKPTKLEYAQSYVPIGKEEWKFDALVEVYSHMNGPYIIYCNDTQKIDELTQVIENGHRLKHS